MYGALKTRVLILGGPITIQVLTYCCAKSPEFMGLQVVGSV